MSTLNKSFSLVQKAVRQSQVKTSSYVLIDKPKSKQDELIEEVLKNL